MCWIWTCEGRERRGERREQSGWMLDSGHVQVHGHAHVHGHGHVNGMVNSTVKGSYGLEGHAMHLGDERACGLGKAVTAVTAVTALWAGQGLLAAFAEFGSSSAVFPSRGDTPLQPLQPLQLRCRVPISWRHAGKAATRIRT